MPQMSHKAKLALVTALSVLVGGAGVAGVSMAQSASERGEQPPYRSSIQVPNTGRAEQGEAGEQGEAKEQPGAAANESGSEQGEAREQAGAESAADRQEAAQLQGLARVSADQARTAALARAPGQVTQVSLDNENGNLVYSVEVRDARGKVQDVKVDAGNAQVLHVEQDGNG